MKLLLVAMNSIHFVRWTEQLKEAEFEVYWFDILDSGGSEKLPWVKQINGWKYRFSKYKVHYFIKKRFPRIYSTLNFLFENNTAKTFEKVLLDVQPDVVHSFVLYISCTPIISVMKKYQNISWIYSSWGSDLFYFKNLVQYKRDIINVLPRIDYLITDCKRDIVIAKDLGFNGKVLGTFPGGGGFNHEELNDYVLPINNREIILVKGYQGRSGRCIEVLKALMTINKKLEPFKIIVFATDNEVINFIETKVNGKLNIEYYARNKFLPHQQILKLMGKALIYIGNSNSDGMPNTLIEAIIMGAFPIQSNPGGATAEIIAHNKNGLLIEDCESVEEISELVSNSIFNKALLELAYKFNLNELKPQFHRDKIKQEVLEKYNLSF